MGRSIGEARGAEADPTMGQQRRSSWCADNASCGDSGHGRWIWRPGESQAAVGGEGEGRSWWRGGSGGGERRGRWSRGGEGCGRRRRVAVSSPSRLPLLSSHTRPSPSPLLSSLLRGGERVPAVVTATAARKLIRQRGSATKLVVRRQRELRRLGPWPAGSAAPGIRRSRWPVKERAVFVGEVDLPAGSGVVGPMAGRGAGGGEEWRSRWIQQRLPHDDDGRASKHHRPQWQEQAASLQGSQGARKQN
ncbi:hypothetical protein OsI_19368 [Oryza sativa Indica Group]|uniref:Uncharacterized protein n=1 Tax=Oryza sativa subsp. indica TaxID=39946 RepID=B8AWB6_ORYSI|nr:hypothetical protein OsI_19368 [Oryza sativa Indica Group]